MNKAEILKAIKEANDVYAFSPITRHDGAYLKVTKSFLIDLIKNSNGDETDFAAEISGPNLYLA